MTTLDVAVRTTCRACGEPIQPFLDLGPLRLNAFPATLEAVDAVPQVPLTLCGCVGCGLVQLDRTVPPDRLYREYWYRSGVNESMVAELQAIVEEACDLARPARGASVLDIGANDGTLLAHYKVVDPSLRRYANEPAANLLQRLNAHAEVIDTEYFPSRMDGAPYQIITAVAVCYDLGDPTAFFQAIHDQLAPYGVAIVQFQDFGQQLSAAAFDNCVHEHLEYYTLWSLSYILRQTGLSIQRVQRRAINGGSLRVILRRQEDQFPAEASVAVQLIREGEQSLDTPTLRRGNPVAFQRFHDQVQRVQTQIRTVLEQVREAGQILDIYGGSTKGNITLQILGIGPTEARQAIDRSAEKHGRYTITGIPIVSEKVARAKPADVWFCPIWQFKAGVLKREADFLRGGGTIIFPLPGVEIVRDHLG